MRFASVRRGSAFFSATGIALGLIVASQAWGGSRSLAAGGNSALIERGRYLSLAADCVSCHTAPGGRPYAGGYPLKSPLGTLYGTNITPDAQTGIGNWTQADFEQAVRHGIRKDGAYLYPAMPYGSYTQMSDADVDALWAYFRSIPAVAQEVPKDTLPFPFTIRSGMAVWRALYFKPGVFTKVDGKSTQWNRGAYLVKALAHCNECHTPRNLAQGLEPQHELTGAQIEGWYAPDISSAPSSNIRQWSQPELVKFLKTGTLPNNAKAFGPMQEVIHDSLQFLTNADLLAMVTYLKDQPRDVTPQRSSPVKFDRLNAGQRVYEDNCLSCHQGDGRGRDASIPALSGNDAVNAREPYNVIMAILEGFPPQGSWGAMSSFAATLSDDQIADVTNYVRTAWNRDGLANATPWSVSSWRKQASTPQNESHAQLCPNLQEGVIQPALAIEPAKLRRAAADRQQLSQVVDSYRSEVPKASRAEIVEALSTAYCRVLAQDSISEARMGAKLADFAQQVAVALRKTAPTG